METGRLHRLHQGVYAVGHAAPSLRRTCVAAVLACGRDTPGVSESGDTVLGWWGGAVSHRSAAELWTLLPSSDGLVDVSIPGIGGKKGQRGIRLHRSRRLLPAFVTLRDGIPVTRPARTIADLRAAVRRGAAGAPSERELRRAIRQANVLGLPVDQEAQRVRTRSDLEEDFLSLCERHRLPEPQVNVRVGRHLVDFLWPERMLVVETDGYGSHRGRLAFEEDRGRDLDLRAMGFDVIRVAEKQMEKEPDRVVEVVDAALCLNSPRSARLSVSQAESGVDSRSPR